MGAVCVVFRFFWSKVTIEVVDRVGDFFGSLMFLGIRVILEIVFF